MLWGRDFARQGNHLCHVAYSHYPLSEMPAHGFYFLEVTFKDNLSQALLFPTDHLSLSFKSPLSPLYLSELTHWPHIPSLSLSLSCLSASPGHSRSKHRTLSLLHILLAGPRSTAVSLGWPQTHNTRTWVLFTWLPSKVLIYIANTSMKETQSRNRESVPLKEDTAHSSFLPEGWSYNCLPWSPFWAAALWGATGMFEERWAQGGVTGRDHKINKMGLNRDHHQHSAWEQGSAYREPLWRNPQNPFREITVLWGLSEVPVL